MSDLVDERLSEIRRLTASNPAGPVAVVDIGSNSVRLVVFEALKVNPAPIYNEKVTCGLGRQVPSRGRMGKQSIDRALKALRRFRGVVDALGASPMHVIATAAAREARDGPAFIAAAEEICGGPIQVLSGEEEASLATAGVLAGFQDPDGIAGDLGGGSLELMNVSQHRYHEWATMPIGGLRLIEGGGTDFEKVRKIIDDELDKIDWINAGNGRPFYAVGGSWRAFARLHMYYRNYPLHVLHQYSISPGAASRYARYLQERPVDFFGGVEGMSKSRIETVPYGAAILQRLIKRMQPSEIVICATGIREGLLYELLPKEGRREDAFLSTCHLLSNLRARSPQNARELCDWTETLLQALDIAESPEEKRLRNAACLVSDLGWRSHPDYRSEQSVAVLENAASTSINHEGLAFLSLVIYFRHEGLVRDAISDKYRAMTSRALQKRARILGAAMRAAHAVSIGVAGILPEVRLTVRDGALVIGLPRQFANLDGERLKRRFKSLSREVGKKLQIEVQPA